MAIISKLYTAVIGFTAQFNGPMAMSTACQEFIRNEISQALPPTYHTTTRLYPSFANSDILKHTQVLFICRKHSDDIQAQTTVMFNIGYGIWGQFEEIRCKVRTCNGRLHRIKGSSDHTSLTLKCMAPSCGSTSGHIPIPPYWIKLNKGTTSNTVYFTDYPLPESLEHYIWTHWTQDIPTLPIRNRNQPSHSGGPPGGMSKGTQNKGYNGKVTYYRELPYGVHRYRN